MLSLNNFRKRSAPLAILFTILAGPAVGQPSFVSVRREAQVLGSLSGTPVNVDRKIADERVLVIGNGADPRNLLNDLAVSLHATLRADGSGLRLERNSADIARGKADHIRIGERWLETRFQLWDRQVHQEAALGSLVRQVQDVLHQNAEAQAFAFVNPSRVQEVQSRVWLPTVTPAGRLLRRLVSRIGFKELAKVDSEDRRFFSNFPNPEEASMRVDDDDLRRLVLDEDEVRTATSMGRFANDLAILGKKSIGAAGPIRDSAGLRLLLTETRTEDEIGLHLEIYAQSGEKLDQAFVSTNLSPDLVPPQLLAASYEKSNSNSCRWAPLSAESYAFVDTGLVRRADIHLDPQRGSVEPWLNIVRGTVVPSRLPPMLLQPERFEPNNYVVLDALKSISEEDPSRPLICQIPDSAWPYAFACAKEGRIDVTSFRRFLLAQAGCEQVVAGKDLIIRPADAEFSDAMNANRESLGKAIRGFLAEGSVSLKGRSRLFERLGMAASSPVVNWYLKVATTDIPHCTTQADPLIFRLLGSLSDEDWEGLESSGRITLQRSSCDRQILEKIIRCEVLGAEGAKVPELYLHPIELYPNGLSGEVAGKLTASTQTVVSNAFANSNHHSSIVFGPGTVAMYLLPQLRMHQRNNQRLGISESMDRLFQLLVQQSHQLFYPAHQNRYLVTIDLPHGMRMEQKLQEVWGIEKEKVALTDLPDPFLKEAFKAFKSLAASGPSSSSPQRRISVPQ